MKNKRYLLLGLAAVMVLMFIAFSQSFTVFSASDIKLGSDGKPIWVFYGAPSGSGERLELYSTSPDKMGTYTDSDGGKYVPQYDFWLAFEPKEVTCTYYLTEDTKTLDKITNFFKGFFGVESIRYFDVSEKLERSAPIKVTTSKNPEGKTIDGFAPGDSVSFTDGRDGDGQIVIQAQGGLTGKVDCISNGGILTVAQGQSTGKVEYYFDGDVVGFRSKRDSWSEAYRICEISSDKTKLVCRHNGLPGVGTLTVTADAEFLDYRYYPPTSGEPKIVSVTAQESVEKNSYGSVVVKVKNIGDETGTFLIDTFGITLVPSVTSVTLSAGQEKDVFFGIVAPDVKEETTREGSFKMCTTGQFTGKTCSEKSFSVKVVPGKVSTGDCGDGVCQVFETFSTCPNDCKQTPTCDGNFMYVEDGNCRCQDGYNMEKDDYGRQYCEKSSAMTFLILGVFLVIILAMVYFKTMEKPRAKKRRKKR